MLRDVRGSFLFLLLSFGVASACATAPGKPAADSPAATPAGEPAAPAGPPVAKVDGHPITLDEVDAHLKAAGLNNHTEALGDLIDLTLLRAAATRTDSALPPGPITPAARAAAELAVARNLAIELPPSVDVLVVDHAWIQDAPQKAKNAAQKKSLGELRVLVVGGQTIPVAFKKLTGPVDGAAWHIGDHEEYPYTVVPEQAHDLPPGGISPVIPGDGGQHLFQIFARKQSPPDAEAVHPLVQQRLREGKTIEILDEKFR